jgi:hypothetical protein
MISRVICKRFFFFAVIGHSPRLNSLQHQFETMDKTKLTSAPLATSRQQRDTESPTLPGGSTLFFLRLELFLLPLSRPSDMSIS